MTDQNKTAPAVQQPQPQTVKKVVEEETLTKVLSRIDDMQKAGELMIPDNYSPQNALRNAWFYIKEAKDKNDVPALNVCTPDSIILALLKMVVNGLTPVKNQCYFIVRGTTLCLDKSYLGNYSIAKRTAGVLDVVANLIYGKDEFKYEINPDNGRKRIIKHEQDFANISDEDLRGAYCTVTFDDHSTKVEIMNMAQIRKAWNMGPLKGNSPAHNNFPGEMAIKTVMNRALKKEIGSSDDEDLFENENNVRKDITGLKVQKEIAENANQKPLSIAESLKRTEPQQTLNINSNPAKEETPSETLAMPPQAERENIEGPGY